MIDISNVLDIIAKKYDIQISEDEVSCYHKYMKLEIGMKYRLTIITIFFSEYLSIRDVQMMTTYNYAKTLLIITKILTNKYNMMYLPHALIGNHIGTIINPMSEPSYLENMTDFLFKNKFEFMSYENGKLYTLPLIYDYEILGDEIIQFLTILAK